MVVELDFEQVQGQFSPPPPTGRKIKVKAKTSLSWTSHLTAFKWSFPINVFLVVIVLVKEDDLCLILRLRQTCLFWCFTNLISLFSTSYSFLIVDFSVEEEVSQKCFASVWSCTTPGHPQRSALSHSPFKAQTEMCILPMMCYSWTCVISQNIQEENQISKRKPCSHMREFRCPRINLYTGKVQLSLLGGSCSLNPN